MALDELDQRLLHALQIEPRATWLSLAPVVGADAATLARRWARLRADGEAWVTGYRARWQVAILELECDQGQVDAVADALRRDPSIYILDFCSGFRDLLAIVIAPDLATLSEYVLVRLGALGGVRTMRTNLVIELLMDGSHWRLRALDQAEADQIPVPRPPRARAARTVPEDLLGVITDEIWRDGRTSVAAMAERSGYSTQRVSDALALLRASGEVRFRTDIARAETDWPIYTWYFVEAPARALSAVRARLPRIPEVRLAGITASRHNLIIAAWLRNLADVNRFELALGNALEGCRIADRSVVLRMAKQMGQFIGPDTRGEGFGSGPAL